MVFGSVEQFQVDGRKSRNIPLALPRVNFLSAVKRFLRSDRLVAP